MQLKGRFLAVILCILLLWLDASVLVNAAPRLQTNKGDRLVIVIDPGHGGANEGTTQNGFLEKSMTLITAKAMYEELVKYDNVIVHLTRTEDVDLSLKERAEFAGMVNADFLFSLHYNASENHTHYGSEIWIPSQPPFNAYGYQFGYQYMQEMQEMGLFLRGIKTRLNDEGTDYYGIIREAAALSVPAAILEHCHVDEERDVPFCRTEEEWRAMGKADAVAVAKYFGLSSSELGVDYSEEALKLPEVNAMVKVPDTIRDETPPDICMLELLESNPATGEITLQVTATDYDGPLLYYTYSCDGGESFTKLLPWPEVDVLQGTCKDTFPLQLKAEAGEEPKIIVRAYNTADLYTESNTISFLQTFQYNEEPDTQVQEKTDEANEPVKKERHTAGTTSFMPASALEPTEEEVEEAKFLTFLKFCLLMVILVFGTVLIAQMLGNRKRRKRRRQPRKPEGDTRNQME